jgi:hypothetical protein
MRTRSLRSPALGLVVVAVGLVPAVMPACGGDTGRRRLEVELELSALGLDRPNEHGWTVTASEARLDIEGVAFYEGAPLLSRLGELLVARAWAHPGHYEEGEALAELIAPASLDLLGGVASALAGGGVSGHYRSAELWPASDRPAVRLVGTAVRGSDRRPFSAEVRLDAPLRGLSVGAGLGISVEDGPVRLGLRIHADRWLRRVEFADLDASGRIDPDSSVGRALARGIQDNSAYEFELVDGQE